MPSITSKIFKNKIRKLNFSGNYNENLKVFAMTLGGQNKGYVSFPPDYVLLDKVLKEFPHTVVSNEIAMWYEECCNKEQSVLDSIKNPEIHDHRLYDYQQAGVSFLKSAKKSILADSRRLGKTCQSIIASKNFDTTLAVVPSYIIPQWQEEFKKWCDNRVFSVIGTPEQKESMLLQAKSEPYKKFILISYRGVSMPRYVRLLPDWIDCLIVDEAHRISNRKTAQTKAIQFIASKVNNLYFLSGSDFHRRSPEVLYPMLNCINQDRFSSYWNFFYRYVEAYERPGGKGYQIIGPKNFDELAEILASIRLKRTIKDVAPDIPDKVYNTIWVNLSDRQQRIYNDIVQNKMVGELNITEGIALFSYLMRFVNNSEELGFETFEPKFQTLQETIEDILYEGEKVIIFAYHKKYLRKVFSAFNGLTINGEKKKAVYIDGDTSMGIREKNIKSFKEDPEYGMLFATYGTLAEGRNLQEADNIICYELCWNPEVQEQAEDRILHLSKMNKLNIYYILAKNTVDEHIFSVMRGKKAFISEANTISKVIQQMKGEK